MDVNSLETIFQNWVDLWISYVQHASVPAHVQPSVGVCGAVVCSPSNDCFAQLGNSRPIISRSLYTMYGVLHHSSVTVSPDKCAPGLCGLALFSIPSLNCELGCGHGYLQSGRMTRNMQERLVHHAQHNWA